MKALAGILLITMGILMISCSEEEVCEEGIIESPNAIGIIDPTSYQAALTDCRLPKIQSFAINGGEGGQVVGASGTVITIPPQILADDAGDIITEVVDVQLLEFYNPGEVIACQLSTNTLNPFGSIEPTILKGLIYITILSDGVPVNLLENIQFFVPDQNNAEILFQFRSPSCVEVDCEVLWQRNPNTEVLDDTQDNPDGTVSNGYRTFSQELGWISIGSFFTDQDKTVVYAKAPDGYNEINSDVFLLFDSPDIAVSNLIFYDSSLNVFDENFGQMPLGQPATFIFTGRDDTYHFSSNAVIISEEIIGVTLNPSAISEQELINAINAL